MIKFFISHYVQLGNNNTNTNTNINTSINSETTIQTSSKTSKSDRIKSNISNYTISICICYALLNIQKEVNQ